MTDFEILKRAYIDYLQLERRLVKDVGVTDSLQKVYNYIDYLRQTRVSLKINFTNVDLEVGKYFDFAYCDMVVSIDINPLNDRVQLSNAIEIYDENGASFWTGAFTDLEKEVWGCK